MKCVRVNISKVEVERFSLRDGAEMKIYFDDGARKCLPYSSKLDSIEEDVKNILLKINVYEKSQNRVLDAENAMDGFVSVVIDDDENVMEKMKVFFARLREQKRNMKGYGTHEGYIERMNKLQKQVLEIKPKDIRNV